MLTVSLMLDVLCQQGDLDEVDSSPLRPRRDVLTKQYKKKHHGSPIVPPLELYKLQQQDSLPDYAQLSPRERYDGLSTEEALLSPRTRPLTVDTRTIPHECPPSPPHEQVEHSWFERRLVSTSLACMFSFPNPGHVIIPRQLFLSNFALFPCISTLKLKRSIKLLLTSSEGDSFVSGEH